MKKNKEIKKQDSSHQLKKVKPLQNIELSNEKRKELLVKTFGETLLKKVPLFGDLIDYGKKRCQEPFFLTPFPPLFFLKFLCFVNFF